MSEDFDEGDVVELKSGGPRMTVSRVGEGSVECVWFEGDEKKIDEFPEAVLKEYSPPTVG